MQPQPLEVARFGKDRFTGLFNMWLAQTRDRATTVSYDTWMDLRYMQGLRTSVALTMGTFVFDLRHGVVYEVKSRGRAPRIFRVQLDDDFPYVSFRDPANAIDFPWITFPNVFTQAELMTLRRVY
ncbi:hypothetical protein [Cupriavidus sp. SW-Y-13]|uniref:hypothetical protein n=1 Tax=Cupriavidus sp. SW-Y-13 TaxID=2653854 RepID=UPI001F3FAF60|nr:hypothetical protein [Cupriavidus sp. SW-Y-13]